MAAQSCQRVEVGPFNPWRSETSTSDYSKHLFKSVFHEFAGDELGSTQSHVEEAWRVVEYVDWIQELRAAELKQERLRLWSEVKEVLDPEVMEERRRRVCAMSETLSSTVERADAIVQRLQEPCTTATVVVELEQQPDFQRMIHEAATKSPLNLQRQASHVSWAADFVSQPSSWHSRIDEVLQILSKASEFQETSARCQDLMKKVLGAGVQPPRGASEPARLATACKCAL